MQLDVLVTIFKLNLALNTRLLLNLIQSSGSKQHKNSVYAEQDLQVSCDIRSISALLLQVPWASLGRSPVLVELDRLYILAGQKADYLSEEEPEVCSHRTIMLLRLLLNKEMGQKHPSSHHESTAPKTAGISRLKTQTLLLWRGL